MTTKSASLPVVEANRWAIGIPLIFALLLSVLNAIMGVARSLFQASEDRLIPKFFAHKNKHHSPDHAMFFNLACALVVALFGSPVRIYIFSNVGYLIAIVAALDRPGHPRLGDEQH